MGVLTMQGSAILFMFMLLMLKYLVYSIHLSELRAPAQVAEGGEALLGCPFDMENDILYSVKWYKEGREFYRYLPSNSPPVKYFAAPGVHVDMARSSSNVVTLVNITRKSTGLYRCEVSGEAPLFATKYDQKYITVYLLPETPPEITGLRKHYKIGDRLTAKCRSTGSQPEAHLKWLINNDPAPRKYVHGPWNSVSNEKQNATDTILHLSFIVSYDNFLDGYLVIKCQATVAPLYQQETVHKVISPLKLTMPSLFEEIDDPYSYLSWLGTTVAVPEETTFQIEESTTGSGVRIRHLFWFITTLIILNM